MKDSNTKRIKGFYHGKKRSKINKRNICKINKFKKNFKKRNVRGKKK